MANYNGVGGRPTGRRNATPEELALFWQYVDVQKFSPEAAAKRLGFGTRTGRQWANDRDAGRKRTPGKAPMLTAASETPPKGIDDLDEVAYAAIQDTPEAFALFRREYLGRDDRPWQIRAAKVLIDAEREGWSSADLLPFYLLMTVAPGSGKSTLIEDYATWRIVRYRALAMERRVQLGSRTMRQAESYTHRVKTILEVNVKLIRAYGRFKPLEPAMWERGAFIIETLPGVYHDEKEPTVMAASQDSGFLGFRGHLCLWDDLVSKANNRTVEAREGLQAWWADEAESRVEPGGLVALVGTRHGPTDLFASLAGLKVAEAADDRLDVTADEVELAERPIYHVITYPVHDERACPNPSDPRASAHKGGCLLDARRYSWRRIQMLRAQLRGRFELTYQQNDADLDAMLVRMSWIDGSEDETGQHPGCLDYQRGMWEALPPFALEDYGACITVDPSPTKFWAVQLLVHDRKHDVDYLVAQERKRMQAIDLLDLKPGTLEYSGILEEWVLKAREIGINLRYLIIEHNAAQRFLTQYAFFRDWARSRGIVIIGHTTGANLLDPHYGIETIATRFLHGQVSLPYRTPITRARVKPLIDELLTFPDGDTDDTVKAFWFFHYNRDRIRYRHGGPRYTTRDDELTPALAATRHGSTWN